MEEAENEIDKSLFFIKKSMAWIGLSFDPPKNRLSYFRQKTIFLVTVFCICYHIFGDIIYIGVTLSNSPKMEDLVQYFHTFGFGIMSISKASVLWYKKDVFSQLIKELVGFWPIPPLHEELQDIKDRSLSALRLAQRWYYSVNAFGVWFYYVTPIASYVYHWYVGHDATIGYIWATWYPFDKTQPIAHAVVFIYEMFIGQTCVWITISTDLLFSMMASHISMLLRLLQKRIESLASIPQTNEEYYREILAIIKVHQRLISYCNNLEDAFGVSLLFNIILSSVNICCCVFVVVLLDPLWALGNKFFLGSALIQIGIICWYGDTILHANGEIATSAYNSCWYLTDVRCRRALLVLMIRAQKPIAFTAMKFTIISLVTYSTILTRSYSYFALLYTMFSGQH